MSTVLEELAKEAGVEEWFPHQLAVFEEWDRLNDPFMWDSHGKMCIYHPTGAGKSITALACMALLGINQVTVLAPPITHDQWVGVGARMGIDVIPMSHAKYRQQSYRHQRNMPLIVDELHLLGGHTGKGWTKLDRMAAGLQAPLIIMSATPNYNDAERCYCIVHVINPMAHRGGFIGWLYANCVTEQNPFGMTPLVKGFLQYGSASDFLDDQPGVVYLPDSAPDIVVDYPITKHVLPDEFHRLGLDRQKRRIFASGIEKRHAARYKQILNENDRIHPHIFDALSTLAGEVSSPSIIYCDHSTIAVKVFEELKNFGVNAAIVTGDTPLKAKQKTLEAFIGGQYEILIGTATMATGPDGMDRMCDQIIILDDTDDDSLRRQLVGRILPRGANRDFSRKRAPRFVYPY